MWSWQQLVAPVPDLSAGETTLLLVEISSLERDLARLTSHLSDEEYARADRFVKEADRKRFIAGRGLLRLVLGHHYRCAPNALFFRTGPFGKPEVESPRHTRRIYFNLSHSGNYVLLGFSLTSEIGVDIEEIQEHYDVGSISAQYFSTEERMSLQRLSEVDRPGLFFQFWTVREALLKAAGLGLSGLDRLQLQVPTSSAGGIGFSAIVNNIEWQVTALPRSDNYVAAVAVGSPEANLSIWRWQFER